LARKKERRLPRKVGEKRKVRKTPANEERLLGIGNWKVIVRHLRAKNIC